MAITISGFSNGTKVINALDTYNYTVLSDGTHSASLRITEVPTSGLSIAIKKNGSTVVTSIAPSNSQSVINVQASIPCVASDIISFVLTSSASNDQQLNNLKGILNIHIGPSN